MAMGQPYWCLERAPRMVDLQRMYEKGGFTMNDPEVMERIAVALERIAFFLELHVRGEE